MGDLALTNGVCGNEEKCNHREDPSSSFDLWTVGVLLGFCEVDGDVLMDVFEILGESEVGHAVWILLENDAVKKVTQMIA